MANFDQGVTTDLVKSDTANVNFDWFMVTTTAGSVVLDSNGGNSVTLASVPVGVWIPSANATNIKVASTAVGFMVV